ncbi:MAG: hypothetical protein COT28_11240 [Methylobacterium sp. CG08_land_8_20_14_0_20_71_15]|uniref:Uncharacterized protein n=2 Tax=Methylobacteriaceae TaxID=119045 RepID=A0ABQ4STC0_9HYPH|nr:MAG: hypothetical protein COT56_06905 [Methylobacterium sp. CG09_land_8_20_14_0_10_71_15]PIU13482.1 MAG: hypothetical protein COT28_11240 [Methylobacterium sp. CG08_land_8_20_14_0_20_71_15]GJE05103.1 hypothetical protein AOPFMNJM_0400 [Methylobacterium jeotgali]
MAFGHTRLRGPGWHCRLPVRLAVAASLLMPTAGRAVTPMSPHLDRASLISLSDALSAAGISDVEGSAVQVALLAVLGSAPAERRYRYREPYPQLPDVDAAAAASGNGCAEVTLHIRPKGAARRPAAILGVYCLLDPVRLTWGERSLRLAPR